MAVEKINLDNVYSVVDPKMTSMEADVVKALGSLGTGGDMTQAELLKLQFNIARYTITASTYSALMKEISDSLKQTASKFN
jgi:hypothetical protein